MIPDSPTVTRAEATRQARRSVVVGVWVNGALALFKGAAGVFGHSHALIADAAESASDVVGSFVVWMGLRVASSPATEHHPYGKGRVEAMAAMLIALALGGTAVAVAVTSVHEIVTPHKVPHPLTLVALIIVVVVKESLFRYSHRKSQQTGSLAVQADAWHHRSDAITSAAAFIGITIAVIGGPSLASADDWAALVAAGVMLVNAYNLLRPAVSELTDATPDRSVIEEVRRIAGDVEGVMGTHRCWIRKLGFDYFVDLDILVEGGLTVKQGHDIAHEVNRAVTDRLPFVRKVMVHVEPHDDYGRHKLEWES